MSGRGVKAKRPQPHDWTCGDCDGRGSFVEDEWDEDGSVKVRVVCETCSGCGLLRDCSDCDAPAPLTTVEITGGWCGPCAAHRELHGRTRATKKLRRLNRSRRAA